MRSRPEFVLALLEVRAEGGDARTPSSPIYYNYTMRTPDTWTTPSMQPLPPGAFALSLEYLWLAATQSAADAGILPASTALTFQLQSDASVCTTTEWIPIGGAFCASVSSSSSPAPVFDRFVTLLLSVLPHQQQLQGQQTSPQAPRHRPIPPLANRLLCPYLISGVSYFVPPFTIFKRKCGFVSSP